MQERGPRFEVRDIDHVPEIKVWNFGEPHLGTCKRHSSHPFRGPRQVLMGFLLSAHELIEGQPGICIVPARRITSDVVAVRRESGKKRDAYGCVWFGGFWRWHHFCCRVTSEGRNF
jgi:hypothetical protein